MLEAEESLMTFIYNICKATQDNDRNKDTREGSRMTSYRPQLSVLGLLIRYKAKGDRERSWAGKSAPRQGLG